MTFPAIKLHASNRNSAHGNVRLQDERHEREVRPTKREVSQRTDRAWRKTQNSCVGQTGKERTDSENSAVWFALSKIFLEDPARLGVAQLSDRALLDLAHALTCYLELLAHFFERVVMVIYQPEP